MIFFSKKTLQTNLAVNAILYIPVGCDDFFPLSTYPNVPPPEIAGPYDQGFLTIGFP